MRWVLRRKIGENVEFALRSSGRFFLIFGVSASLFCNAPNAPEVRSVVVLGGGMGALTSSLYLGRAKLDPLVIEGKTPGGLLTQSHSVQNWPGEMEIEGALLTEKMREQAEANGVEFLAEEVVSVDFSKRPFVITTKPLSGKGVRKIMAQSCIIAMGSEPNFLHIPGETGPNGYWGRGVTNCAICDGNLYRGKSVAVVGGGDAAVLEALYLSNLAKDVTVFVRKDKLRAIEQKRIEALLAKENVKIIYNTELTKISGNGKEVTSVFAKSGKGEAKEYPIDGVFLAIGSTPNSKIFKGILELDSQGYIVLKKNQQTSVEGVYAVGDIVDPFFKQAVSAAGDGAKAALQAQQFVSDRMDGLASLPKKLKPVALDGEVLEIRTVAELDRILDESDLPIVVDFYATWCGPCKRVAPAFDAAAAKLQGKVRFLKVNVDQCQGLSDQYAIRSMPTAVVFQNGGEVDRKIGLHPILGLLEGLEAR